MFSYRVDDEITLRLPEESDAEPATALVRKNLDHLNRWMPWAVEDYSETHALQWISMARIDYAKDGRFGAVICLRGEMIGGIGFHDLDLVHRHASIGYWIDKDHEGRGIVTKCCRVLLQHLFDTMKLHRVQINCNIENTRSRAIPERLGFKFEGVMREVELLGGRFGDWAVYSLLENEWRESQT